MSDATKEFCDNKMKAAMERLEEWLLQHPEASAKEGADELFHILMGDRDQ